MTVSMEDNVCVLHNAVLGFYSDLAIFSLQT